MKNNILLLAILVMSNGKLFGLEQKQNNITSHAQGNSLHEQTANQNTGPVQSGIHNLELLAFAANFVANNSEAVSALKANNQLVSSSSSNSSSTLTTQETAITHDTDETGSTIDNTSSTGSSSSSTQNDVLPVWIDGTKAPRLYKCPLCNQYDKRGRKKTDIERHIKFHTKIKHIECPYQSCKKLFALKQYLNRHIQTQHTRENFFACPHCTVHFSQKSSLKRHMYKRKKPCVPLVSSSSSIQRIEITDNIEDDENES